MDNLSMGITAFSGTLTGAMGGSGKVVSAGDAAEEQRQCEFCERRLKMNLF